MGVPFHQYDSLQINLKETLARNASFPQENGMSSVKQYRFLLSCVFAFFAGISSASAEAVDNTPQTINMNSDLANQGFHCHKGYRLDRCEKDLAQLKAVLAHYPVDELGQWTWILVQRDDWEPVLRRMKLDPRALAFTAFDERETFLEEPLFGHNVERAIELMTNLHVPVDQFLSFAVAHELGHALCRETDEMVTARFAEELRKGHIPPCRIPKMKRSLPF